MGTNQRLAVVLFVSGLVLLAPRAGFAGPDALTDKAAALYDEGMGSYAKAKWPQARASFLAAWSLKNHWQIAGSLGDCEVQLGLYREAAGHLAYFLRLAPPERRSAQAQRLYDVARSKIGTLAVTVDLRDADITIDGKVVGKAPLEDPVFVEPGHHVVEVRLRAKFATAGVDVAAGERREVALSPAPEATASPTTVPAPAGSKTGILIAGGTVAGVGVIAGVVLAVLSNGKADNAAAKYAAVVKQRGPGACDQSGAPGCQDLHDALVSRSTLGSAAAWSLVGAGAVGAATLAYGLLAPRGSATGAPRVGLVTTGRDAGLVVRGTW